MFELLAQVQQLLAGASSQPLTAIQLSQILSALAASSSADPVPFLVMPSIISPPLAITPPPTITFSPVSTIPHLIPSSYPVQETIAILVENIPALPVSDTLV